MQQLLDKDGVQIAVADIFVAVTDGFNGHTGSETVLYPLAVIGDGCTVGDYTPPVPIHPIKQVPEYVDIAQARHALLQHGFLQKVDDEINAMDEPFRSAAKIDWEYRARIKRDNPFVLQIGALIGFNSDKLDELFIEASTL